MILFIPLFIEFCIRWAFLIIFVLCMCISHSIIFRIWINTIVKTLEKLDKNPFKKINKLKFLTILLFLFLITIWFIFIKLLIPLFLLDYPDLDPDDEDDEDYMYEDYEYDEQEDEEQLYYVNLLRKL